MTDRRDAIISRLMEVAGNVAQCHSCLSCKEMARNLIELTQMELDQMKEDAANALPRRNPSSPWVHVRRLFSRMGRHRMEARWKRKVM